MSDIRHSRLPWLFLVGLVALAWWGSLDAPFVYDDKIEVVGNRTIRMLEHWREIGSYNRSRPLLIFSYAWNFDREGFEPFGYHLTNLGVHAAAAVAAFTMLGSVGRLLRVEHAVLRAFAVVSLWAVHPMVTESVTYTTGRSETLCGAFCFVAVAAWAGALLRERAGERGWPMRLAAIAAFVCAALSKEVAVVLPAIFIAVEWAALSADGVPSGDRLRRRRWLWLAPIGLGLAAAVMLRLQQPGPLLPVEVERSLGVQITTSVEVWRRYLQLWLVPVGQTLFHAQADLEPLSARGGLAWLGWGAMVSGAVWVGRRRPVVGLALVCAALTLVPSTSVAMLKEHMAEHRSYQAGLWLLAAMGLGLPLTRRRAAAGAWAALLVAAVIGTRARNAVWASEVALWEEAAERMPESAEAWYGVGDARRFAKDFTGAVDAYTRSSELDPSHVDTWNNLGIAHAEVGDVGRAKKAWRAALDVRPSYCKAHNNLGSLAYRFKEWEEARRELQSTLAYCPDSVVAHYLLGNIYYGPRRDKRKARVHYETVVALDPFFDHGAVVKERLLELTW